MFDKIDSFFKSFLCLKTWKFDGFMWLELNEDWDNWFETQLEIDADYKEFLKIL